MQSVQYMQKQNGVNWGNIKRRAWCSHRPRSGHAEKSRFDLSTTWKGQRVTLTERERVGEWKREADSATERPLAYLAGVHCSLRSTCLRLVSAAVATWTVAGPSAEVIGQGKWVGERRGVWRGYFASIVSSSPTCLPIGNNTVSLVLLSSVWFIMQRVAQSNSSPTYLLLPPTIRQQQQQQLQAKRLSIDCRRRRCALR